MKWWWHCIIPIVFFGAILWYCNCVDGMDDPFINIGCTVSMIAFVLYAIFDRKRL